MVDRSLYQIRRFLHDHGPLVDWLIGPYVEAWLKLHPDRPAEARRFLAGLVAHIEEACIGSISEVFDAEPPYLPRGCIAQAWSVAEVLRCWVKTAVEAGDSKNRS